VLIGSCLCIF